jgi:hypothetical protein
LILANLVDVVVTRRSKRKAASQRVEMTVIEGSTPPASVDVSGMHGLTLEQISHCIKLIRVNELYC